MKNTIKRVKSGNSENSSTELSTNEEARRLGRRPRQPSDNTERALIASSRRKDRGADSKIVSARKASQAHFYNQGRYFYLTEDVILRDSVWEDLLDAQQLRDPNLILPTGVSVELVLRQYAQDNYFPMLPNPLPTRNNSMLSPNLLAPNDLATNTFAQSGLAANTFAQNGLGMTSPPLGTTNPAAFPMMPLSTPLPQSQIHPLSSQRTPEQRLLELEKLRSRMAIMDSYMGNMHGFQPAQVLATGFCDTRDPRPHPQSVQPTFFASPGTLHPPQSTSLGQQQMFPFEPATNDPPSPFARRGAIDLGAFDPIFDASEKRLTDDNRESDEQKGNFPSSDEINNIDMQDGDGEENEGINETMTEADDCLAKGQIGPEAMITADEHLAQWKNGWDKEPSEFEDAFADTMDNDGTFRSWEDILNLPEHPNKHQMLDEEKD